MHKREIKRGINANIQYELYLKVMIAIKER